MTRSLRHQADGLRSAEADGEHNESHRQTWRRLWFSWGQKWRSSTWFITLVVSLGVATDAISYTIVVPVLPYRLQALGYDNISALTGWLLFAYSIGIFLMTFPVAWFFARRPYRRGPLVIAVLALEGGLLIFMLARPYWVMVFSRFIQGAASTVVWTVGFALICENVEEQHIGRQIGFAFAGVSIGSTIAPPIGGALYRHLGWNAPLIFTIIICAVDFILRLLVIEQKDLPRLHPVATASRPDKDAAPTGDTEALAESPSAMEISEEPQKKELSPWGVLLALAKSPRGVSGFVSTFVFGLFLGTLDPALPLRVETVWNKDSDFVGLVYLAASAPSFLTGPLVGAIADRYGSEWIMFPAFLFTIPWIPLLILKSSLPAFVVFFAIGTTTANCALGPVGLEVAMAAREVDGMSEIHQFAAVNIAFSISTSIGSIAGGQLYDHVSWAAVCWFVFGSLIFALPFPFILSGNRPLAKRLFGKSTGEE